MMPPFALRPVLVIGSAFRRMKSRLLNLIEMPVVVLLYHRVATLTSDFHSLAVSPENFRQHMQHLKQNFHVVRFEEDWSTVKKPAIAITFDDGYADNLYEALPILEEVGVPAAFFITTGNILSGNEFWWDELERLVLAGTDYPRRFALDDLEHGTAWPTTTHKERSVMFWNLHQAAKKISEHRRVGWMNQIREWAGPATSAQATRLMTRDELKELAQSKLVTIGAHTITHMPLSFLDDVGQRREIVMSGKELEMLLGRKITVFSYPFGGRDDYDMTSVRICREAGYVRAAAAFPGEARGWTDPYQIPRCTIPNCGLVAFAARLKALGI